jgi:hypothetical protein
VTYSQIWLISFVDDCQCGYIKNWKTKQNKSLVPTTYLPTYLPVTWWMINSLVLQTNSWCPLRSANIGPQIQVPIKKSTRRGWGCQCFFKTCIWSLDLRPEWLPASQNWTQKKPYLPTYLPTCLSVCLTGCSIPWFPRPVDRYLSIQVCKCRSSNPRADKEKYKRRTGMSVFVLRPVLRSRSR